MCNKPEKDLLAYYPLDETSGTVAKDCSGLGHDGTVIGQAPVPGVWTTGKFGGGFTTGNSACIDLGKPAKLLREGESFTVSVWANATAFGSPNSYYVVGRTREPNNAGWRLGADTGAAWGTKFNDATNGPVTLSSPIGNPTDVWTHIAVTFTPNDSAKVYVGGSLAGTTGLTTITVDDPATIRIGCKGDGSLYFRGALDEVRFYGRAFSAAEIATLAARAP